jgi:hypothetical protein
VDETRADAKAKLNSSDGSAVAEPPKRSRRRAKERALIASQPAGGGAEEKPPLSQNQPLFEGHDSKAKPSSINTGNAAMRRAQTLADFKSSPRGNYRSAQGLNALRDEMGVKQPQSNTSGLHVDTTVRGGARPELHPEHEPKSTPVL